LRFSIQTSAGLRIKEFDHRDSGQRALPENESSLRESRRQTRPSAPGSKEAIALRRARMVTEVLLPRDSQGAFFAKGY